MTVFTGPAYSRSQSIFSIKGQYYVPPITRSQIKRESQNDKGFSKISTHGWNQGQSQFDGNPSSFILK